MTINHGLCSELLGPFLRGELEPDRRSEVEAHLASCEACREELGALQALSGPEVEPLSELESARLHRDVWAAVGSLPRPERRSLGARLVPYLGTAAVLALFAVGAVTLSGGGADNGSSDAAGQRVTDSAEEKVLSPNSGGGEVGADAAVEAGHDAATDESVETLDAVAPEDSSSSAEPGATGYLFSKQQAFGVGCKVGMGGTNSP
jgi:hypothetical protein